VTRARALAVLGFWAVATFSTLAHADGARIVLVTSRATPFGARIQAEIEAMGFTVDAVDHFDDTATPAPVAAARIVADPPPGRIELWIKDPHGGRLELRAVIQSTSGADEETQTVRASEQLRALLQPLRERPPPPPSATPASARSPDLIGAPLPVMVEPAQVEPRAEGTSAPRFLAGAAVEVALQSGGAGVDAALSFRWMATRILGVGAIVHAPITGSTVTSTQGSASVTATLFGAELSAMFLDRRAVRLAAVAGLAAAWLRTNGSAMAPYVGHADSVVTSLPTLGLEVMPRVAERVHLVAAGRLGVSLPQAEIAFGGRNVAVWGRPFGLVSAGASFDF
jgi:hypothetical protein